MKHIAAAAKRIAIACLMTLCLLAPGILVGCGTASSDSATQPFELESEYGSLRQFSAKTLSGDVFTQDDLLGYDLTMVNVWQTTCGPCIHEAPGLQQLAENLPDNVNMITICADGLYHEGDARDIVAWTGTTYPVLLADEELFDVFLNNVAFTPTTVFVDRYGNILGDLVGAPPTDDPDQICAAYQELIDEYLVVALDNYTQAA